jgi:hypothetical protein
MGRGISAPEREDFPIRPTQSTAPLQNMGIRGFSASGRAREGDGEDRGRSILEPVSTGFLVRLEAPDPVLKQTAQAR